MLSVWSAVCHKYWNGGVRKYLQLQGRKINWGNTTKPFKRALQSVSLSVYLQPKPQHWKNNTQVFPPFNSTLTVNSSDILRRNGNWKFFFSKELQVGIKPRLVAPFGIPIWNLELELYFGFAVKNGWLLPANYNSAWSNFFYTLQYFTHCNSLRSKVFTKVIEHFQF